MLDMHPTYRPTTLCEVCKNALGFCPWSEKDNQRPVPGWEAIRKDLLAGDGRKNTYTESYIVLRCPRFDLEEHNRWAYERFDPEHILAKITGLDPRKGVSKKVRCINTGVVYSSVMEAARRSGCAPRSIRTSCTGVTKGTRDGIRWEYVEEKKT